MNQKTLKLLTLISLLLAVVTPSLAQYTTPMPQPVLKFVTMVGVNGAFLGPNDVRGIVGDSLPWVAAHIRGVILSNGQLKIHIRGLVFPNIPSVPPELRGINNESSFRATVSCLVDDGAGNLVTTNVSTAGFPATTSGNADILTTVQLPNPCAAPIIFILGESSDRWFAMSGVRTGAY